MLFISFPINAGPTVQTLQQGHGRLGQAQGHGRARRQLAARARRHGGGGAKPGGVQRARRIACCAPSRSIRGMADCWPARKAAPSPSRSETCPSSASGAQPEWLGKKALAAAGVRVPDGDLAKTADEAVAVAKRIGYPVALKAQAAALSHKTEAGGVILNLADDSALRAAWDTLMRNVKRAAPGVTLDGALVEKMSPKGVELMVGAKRDPQLGHGAAARPRRHLGRGAGRRATAAGRRRRAADRRGAAQAPHGEAARRLPRRAAGRYRGGRQAWSWRSAG